MKKRWIEPVTLSGSNVLLEPLSFEHLDGMIAAVRGGELWNLWYTSIPSPENVEEYVRIASAIRENAGAMPFAARDRESNTVIGCTRYFNVDEINQGLEIGPTWDSRSYQR